ncbi:MAG: hydantoinase/oxoprolinase family protein [Eubacteriales bacterium]|nr:hydantoinase/oxoprolinase family protein [Eubacteriales bacterium]
MLGLGIDTGGTCTDAVIYDLETREILSAGKALTTKSNLEIGIANALDTLPQEYMHQIEAIALSTTLATNTCVENKGARAKLLMIGFEERQMEPLRDVFASYGLDDFSQFVMLDAKAENLYSHPYDPDWEELRRRAKEYFGECDAVGIVQLNPRANGHRFELTAREILREELTQPITISYDIAKETDILKTCVGTLLNARLIPLITEFMEAVHHVAEQRGLKAPISIVRSDGSLMSESMAQTCPVETLLCGPAASVMGAHELAQAPNAVIIDMGGTTTDMAIQRGGLPLMTDTGVHIGQWTTMLHGVFIDTFGLGGDSAIRFREGQLYLDTVRVIPISMLAAEYAFVEPELEAFAACPKAHSRAIYEYYVLLKDISAKTGYTEDERRFCDLLKERPLMMREISKRLHLDPYYIHTERLEREGILIRSGLTPTDMMAIKGDYPGLDDRAARLAMFCMGINLSIEIESIPDRVYEMVYRRLYKNIARAVFTQEYPFGKQLLPEALDRFLDCCYEQATERQKEGDESLRQIRLALSTDLTLVGVGAPIHVFLPRVAKLLCTEAAIPKHAGVANAVGAISGKVSSKAEIVIEAIYHFGVIREYRIVDEGKQYTFKQHDEAVKLAKEMIKEKLRKKNTLQGIAADSKMNITVRRDTVGDGYLYQTIVEAKTEALTIFR